MEFETQEKELKLMRLIEGAKGENLLSEEELIERIDMLKEDEANIRAERQDLEKQLRHMKFESLLSRRDEG